MFQCSVLQAPPPANAMSIQGGLGQATRFLVFLKEIKAKPVRGLVCHSSVGVCSTAM